MDDRGHRWTRLGDLRIRRLGIRVLPGVLKKPPLRWGLSSPAEFDAPVAFVGPRLGREVSSPDTVQPSDESLDIGGEEVGVAQ
jgi:hypothetical protein